MKTKGALLWEIGKQWSVEEIDVGDPQPGEVTVQLAASGLCHSDEHLRTGATPTEFPMLGGHEGAGVVIKVGAGVTELQEGDHVVTAFIPACGHCPSCSDGHQNLCDLGACCWAEPPLPTAPSGSPRPGRTSTRCACWAPSRRSSPCTRLRS